MSIGNFKSINLLNNLKIFFMNYYFEVLKKYAVFSGRARRAEFWYFFLFSIIVSVILGVIDSYVGNDSLENIYGYAVLIPGIAVGVRRVHDIHLNGWYSIIPFYNIYLFCLEGDTFHNQFGEDPKGTNSTSVVGEKLDDNL